MIEGDSRLAAAGAGRGASALLRRDREREFLAARRHSALVRILRWALPGAGALAIALFALSYVVSSSLRGLEGLGLAVNAARITREGIIMDQPRITGTTTRGQRFDVRAARASQNPARPKIVDFADIEATLGLGEGGEVSIAARQGTYDTERETLKFSGPVRIRSSLGHSADLVDPHVDFQDGSFTTAEPVVITSADMRIEASGAAGHGGDRRIEFTGRVRMTVMPSQGAGR